MKTTKLIWPLIFITSAGVARAEVLYYEVDPGVSDVEFTAHATTHDMEGKAGEFWGWLKIDTETRAIQGKVEVKAHSLSSGNSMRDNNTYNLLEVDKYPTIALAITGAEGSALDSAATKEDLVGKQVSVTLKANLTLHGVTNAVSVPITVDVHATSLKGSSSFKVMLTDYGVEPPKFALFEVEDEVDIRVTMSFKEKEE